MASNKLASSMGPCPMDLGMLSGGPKRQPQRQDLQWSDVQWRQHELADDGQQQTTGSSQKSRSV